MRSIDMECLEIERHLEKVTPGTTEEELEECRARVADALDTIKQELDALQEAHGRLKEKLEEKRRSEFPLAKAVVDFAEWQQNGYKDSPETRSAISRQLWFEVSDHVHEYLRVRPSDPCSR